MERLAGEEGTRKHAQGRPPRPRHVGEADPAKRSKEDSPTNGVLRSQGRRASQEEGVPRKAPVTPLHVPIIPASKKIEFPIISSAEKGTPEVETKPEEVFPSYQLKKPITNVNALSLKNTVDVSPEGMYNASRFRQKSLLH